MSDSQAHRVTGNSDATIRGFAPVIFNTMFDYDYAVSGEPAAGIVISKNAVPAGAHVVGGWYKVLTTFTTAGTDAGTIALSLVGANDLITAIAVSDASNPWDIDIANDKPLSRIATKLADAKYVTITSATQVITAGVLIGVVSWVLPEALSSGH